MMDHHDDIYAQISSWIQQLPLNANAPAYPWSGVIINANHATCAHRDVGDDNFCMVLVASDCTGGELVYQELGLVFAAHSGDASVFRSVSLIHFNLDFKGTRGSLVFHSDKAGYRWGKDTNGWKDTVHFP